MINITIGCYARLYMSRSFSTRQFNFLDSYWPLVLIKYHLFSNSSHNRCTVIMLSFADRFVLP